MRYMFKLALWALRASLIALEQYIIIMTTTHPLTHIPSQHYNTGGLQ